MATTAEMEDLSSAVPPPAGTLSPLDLSDYFDAGALFAETEDDSVFESSEPWMAQYERPTCPA